MDVLKAIVATFVAFVLLMAFSSVVYIVWDTVGTCANTTSTYVNDQYAPYESYAYSIYNIIFATIMIGGAIAIFLGIAIKRRRNPYEYERYGGDYEY